MPSEEISLDGSFDRDSFSRAASSFLGAKLCSLALGCYDESNDEADRGLGVAAGVST